MKKLILMCFLLSGCVVFNPPKVPVSEEVMVMESLKKEDLVLIAGTSHQSYTYYFGEAYYGVNRGNYIIYKATGKVIWKPAGYSWVP